MRIDKGEKDGISLDGLSFIVLMHSPSAMIEGNITVGLIVDERASQQQVDAITAIATGAAGGPMAALGPLVGRMAGIERQPIRFELNGMKRSVQAGKLIDQACEGIESGAAPGEALGIPARCTRSTAGLSLAKATRSSMHAFGVDWDDTTGSALETLRHFFHGPANAAPNRRRCCSISARRVAMRAAR